MSKQFTALVLGLMLAAGCLPLAAQTYSFQSFSYPNAPQTWPQAINNRGAVVGGVIQVGQQGGWHFFGFKRDANGFLERPFLAAPTPPKQDTVARGINDHGVIVGNYAPRARASTGFLLYHGVFTYYNVQPGWNTAIWGINNQGDFVGSAWNGQSSYGFINSNGVVTKIQCLNAGIEPHVIAADGTVVGAYGSAGFIRGPAGQCKIIQVPGALVTVASGINNLAHQVVGTYYSQDYINHGFVYDYITDTMTMVDYPGSSYTWINGINSHGVIAGSAQDAQGNIVGFIGTPQ